MAAFDPRRTPMNNHIMAAHLPHAPDTRRVVSGVAATVMVPVADLWRRPDGPRDRQLLCGENVQVFDIRNGYAFVQAVKDGYVGYLRNTDLGPAQNATHRVSTRATHAYAEADFKSPNRVALSLGSQLQVLEVADRFALTNLGHVPHTHLSALTQRASDPVAVAQQLLGTPYLWGGNSSAGIDCSGLVQAAMVACGHPCPGDSDQQEQELGTLLKAGTPVARGDLLFWKGHVAMVVDTDRLIHANVHHMSVAYEGIPDALNRIDAQGDGKVTAHRRV